MGIDTLIWCAISFILGGIMGVGLMAMLSVGKDDRDE